MVVFSEMKNDICGEITNGISEIKRLHLEKNMSRVGLDHKVGDGILYMLHLDEGDKINILFSTEEKLKDRLFLNWKFSSHLHNPWEQKIVDKRDNDFAPTLSILIRDKESKKPVQASLTIEGSREIDALYVGSDLFFNVSRNCNIIIKCDVEGYFFEDRLEKITAYEDQEILIELEKASQGKSIKIENLEFKAGTSEIVPSSIPKLKRLKNFLALNSDINVEIQGHVFLLGDNTFMAQRISEARAKRVAKYLVDNGIDRSRLQAVGYGNTKPVYANPKFFYEEQSNRRVEIMIR
jgi:outer membrane protein OmpA-like peptidoglycan-associated protein